MQDRRAWCEFIEAQDRPSSLLYPDADDIYADGSMEMDEQHAGRLDTLVRFLAVKVESVRYREEKANGVLTTAKIRMWRKVMNKPQCVATANNWES